MPAQALYLKWRPRKFEHVIGQEHITQTLRNALIQDRVRHAYLFNGPRGTGKTTMARLLAKAVNCLHPDPAERPCDECAFCVAINEGRFMDLIEIDAASHNGVDDVRDLREKIAFAPSEGRFKVYIIDEVHRFSGAAFDALLKTLEEPPEHAIFILATTELDKVPATIKSRSLMFEFRRVSVREVVERLQLILDTEKIHAEPAALELVARQGTGSVRDSISLLDQLISDPTQPITVEMAEQVLGTASNRIVGKLVQAILQNSVALGIDLLNQAIDEGADPGQFGRQIVEYLRNLLLVQTAGPSLVDVSDEMRATLQEQAAIISRPALLRAVRAFNTAITEVKGGWQPQLPLELALIESTRPLQEEVTAVAAPAEVSRPPAAKHKTAAPEKKVEPEPETLSEPAASPTEAIPGNQPALALTDVQQAWPQIVKVAREQNKALGALLEHGSIKSIDGPVLTLAVNPASAIFKERLEADDKRKALSRCIKTVLKVNLQIKVVVADLKQPQPTDNDPLLDDLVKSGGIISGVEDSQGGLD